MSWHTRRQVGRQFSFDTKKSRIKIWFVWYQREICVIENVSMTSETAWYEWNSGEVFYSFFFLEGMKKLTYPFMELLAVLLHHQRSVATFTDAEKCEQVRRRQHRRHQRYPTCAFYRNVTETIFYFFWYLFKFFFTRVCRQLKRKAWTNLVRWQTLRDFFFDGKWLQIQRKMHETPVLASELVNYMGQRAFDALE